MYSSWHYSSTSQLKTTLLQVQVHVRLNQGTVQFKIEHSITSLTSSSPTPDIKNQASSRNSIQFYSGSYAYMETHKDHILFMPHIKTSLTALSIGTSLPADVTRLIRNNLHQTCQMSHIKATVAPVQAMKAYRSRGTATHTINLATRWRWWKPDIQSPLSLLGMSCESFIRQRWVVNFKPTALPPENNPQYLLNRRQGGPQKCSGHSGKAKIFFLLPDLLPCKLVAVVNETYWIPVTKIRDNISMLLLL